MFLGEYPHEKLYKRQGGDSPSSTVFIRSLTIEYQNLQWCKQIFKFYKHQNLGLLSSTVFSCNRAVHGNVPVKCKEF